MQFVNSDVVVKNAIAEGIVKQQDVFELQSYLDAYDVALDGRLDHGFFKMQMRPDMYVTVNHPLSRDSALTGRLNRLISTQLSSDEPQQTALKQQNVALDDTLDSPLAIAAAVVLSPLLIFGMISGCMASDYKLLHVAEPNDGYWTDRCKGHDFEFQYGYIKEEKGHTREFILETRCEDKYKKQEKTSSDNKWSW